jgi:hypothetical protein
MTLCAPSKFANLTESLGAAAAGRTTMSRFEHFDLLKRSPLCAVFWQSRDLFGRLLLIIAEQCECVEAI